MQIKRLFIPLVMLLFVGASWAQVPGEKAFKQAKKLFGKYNLDPQANAGDIYEARTNIDIAANDTTLKGDSKVWLMKGQIYNEIATIDVITLGTLGHAPKVPNASNEAFNALKMAHDLADKGYIKKEALTLMKQETTNSLLQMGAHLFGEGKYKEAYTAFNNVLVVREMTGGEILSSDEEYQEQLMRVGLSALRADLTSEAESIFDDLYSKQYDDPFIYEALYLIKQERGDENAISYVEQGLKKYPSSQSLRYASINEDLKSGNYEAVKNKLEAAISEDNENKSLYLTLGNVYDNLFQKEAEAGNDEVAEEFFTLALNNYQTSLGFDAKYFDALYNLGALYYNKAAAITKKMKNLEDDYSKEGLKKYESLKTEVFAFFDKALPHFQKAESIKPSDISVLVALREIYAKKDQIDISNEFKRRLELVEEGGQVEAAYFTN